jgi:formyltetrahydrofolate deformylase
LWHMHNYQTEFIPVPGRNKNTAILLIHCPDNKGIVAQVTAFINDNNGNIIGLDEHVDRLDNIFYMRIEWELDGFLIPQEKIADFFGTLIAVRYNMTWNIYFSDKRPRMAIFVSKLSHCLYDIMSRYQAGEWEVDIPIIISNHHDLKPIADQFGIPFYCFEKNNKNRIQQEQKELELLEDNQITFVVLARYMQILSNEFIEHYPKDIINIHHSFLPAFPGAKPYHSAYARGVKIIGATSHYVTTELDSGPIIEQDIVRVSHRDSIDKLIIKGKDVEKLVLSRAILMHIQHRILLFNNRTVVFH